METDRRDFLIQGAGALAGVALMPGLEAMASRIAKGAPLAARKSKQILRRLLQGAVIPPAELKTGYELCDSEDYKEGVRAFLAKEKPQFKAR